MKTVVVTGATSGIGKATALDLAARRFHVIGTARTPDKAEKLTAAAAELGLTVHTVLLDVTDPRSCQDAVVEIDELTDGGPWALVNNAGIAPVGAFEDVAEADARAALEVNVLGVARMTGLVLPGMRRRREGRIVQMSSLGGLVSVPFNGWYCASKHALEALTDSLRMEIAGSGVHACLIEPGFIDTPLLSKGLADFPADSRYSHGYMAARRLIASWSPPGPETVARTVRRALLAPKPRRRYRCGPGAVPAPLMRLAPAAVADLISRTALRLNKR
ncbi:SDR family oxidoreductase [Streptomyces diastatochromogenes]|uniref:SDR family oxidoreductase n=1 Tax=Streptomyces diastatochromogenes TaxID=42236 RepID=UPI0036518CCD